MENVTNLYVHFPFCRGRCSYCSLHSRGPRPAAERDAYAAAMAAAVRALPRAAPFSTVYFGGGTPALCNLAPLFDALAPLLAPDAEFTVELHPLDATPETLDTLRAGGVNRVSMGVQSLDDAILADMKRGCRFDDVRRAFDATRKRFDNAGIDLISGYPGETRALTERHRSLADWGLRHCSVYALQNERGLEGAADDDTVMDRIAETAAFLATIGLQRYEISNYAVPGRECRHNLAVWRGEDYIGLGDGASGRIGLRRTFGYGGRAPREETVSPEFDAKERRLFSLRTREGLDPSGFPGWDETLRGFEAEGLTVRIPGGRYRLTPRGAEVCDSILSALA